MTRFRWLVGSRWAVGLAAHFNISRQFNSSPRWPLTVRSFLSVSMSLFIFFCSTLISRAIRIQQSDKIIRIIWFQTNLCIQRRVGSSVVSRDRRSPWPAPSASLRRYWTRNSCLVHSRRSSLSGQPLLSSVIIPLVSPFLFCFTSVQMGRPNEPYIYIFLVFFSHVKDQLLQPCVYPFPLSRPPKQTKNYRTISLHSAFIYCVVFFSLLF